MSSFKIPSVIYQWLITAFLSYRYLYGQAKTSWLSAWDRFQSCCIWWWTGIAWQIRTSCAYCRRHVCNELDALANVNFKFEFPNILRSNGINFLFKVIGWGYTGSHSMFAEAIHSLADTINQLILAYGIHKSVQVRWNSSNAFFVI